MRLRWRDADEGGVSVPSDLPSYFPIPFAFLGSEGRRSFVHTTVILLAKGSSTSLQPAVFLVIRHNSPYVRAVAHLLLFCFFVERRGLSVLQLTRLGV